jgi:excinuclease UvrABC helicase subunit UvrB
MTAMSILRRLINISSSATMSPSRSGTFRVKGDTLEIQPRNEEVIFRIHSTGTR